MRTVNELANEWERTSYAYEFASEESIVMARKKKKEDKKQT